MSRHALKRLTYVGVTFRTRTQEEIGAVFEKAFDDLGETTESGAIALPIDSTFTVEKVVDAHAHMRCNAHMGKIAVTP